MDDFPIKTSIYGGFSMAMLNNQMVSPSMPYLSHKQRQHDPATYGLRELRGNHGWQAKLRCNQHRRWQE